MVKINMMDKLKNPYIKFGVTITSLFFLIVLFAIPAFMVRTLGEEVVLEGKIHQTYSMNESEIRFSLSIREVPMEKVSDRVLTAIDDHSNGYRFDDSIDLYLHLYLDDSQHIESVFLDTRKPTDDTLYLTINNALIRRSSMPSGDVTHIAVQFYRNTYYLSPSEQRELNFNIYEVDALLTVRIYRGNIQVMSIQRND